ncbi:hypothetical protein ASG65_01440 [Bacillus sp. Leaf13]|nr:hypothetical protein ASG65_01440 [Bacillus sp. Leaf13]
MDTPELQDVFKKKLIELKETLLNVDEHIQRIEEELKSIDTQPIDADALRNLLSHFDSIINHAIEIKQLLSLFVKDIQITKEPISSEYRRKKSRLITKIIYSLISQLNLWLVLRENGSMKWRLWTILNLWIHHY